MPAKFRIRRQDNVGINASRVKDFQDELNYLAKKFNYDLKVVVDGAAGGQTFRAAKIVGLSLGAGPRNIKAVKDGTITHNLRTLIQGERKAGPKEVARAKRRKRYRSQTRKRLSGGANMAVQWAAQYRGMTEDPYGSNKAPWGLTQWQIDLGTYLVGQPWCGTFVGTAMIRAGVKEVNGSVASVAQIEESAKAASASTISGSGNNTDGFAGWFGEGKRGDAVVLFGYGIHVELVRRRVPGGYLTIGGNTSSGNGGSQDNGGGVYFRFRSDSECRGFARPAY